MKKTIVLLLIVACMCLLSVIPSTAAPDPLAQKFQQSLALLDHFYRLNYEYMIRIASDQFTESFDPVTVPAADFDAVLHKYFVIDEEGIKELRNYGNRVFSTEYTFYDETADTYTFQYYGGFGGNLPARKYAGYKVNGDTYDVYYCRISYEYLEDIIPEGTNIDDLPLHENGFDVIYNGVVYEGGPDGYYRTIGLLNEGRKYTVEMNGDVVRLISSADFTESDMPSSFDDKERPSYDIEENSGVTIPENECFDSETSVKVETINDSVKLQKIDKAMGTVGEKYVAFEFTATKNGASVQPNGKLTVTFALPEGYSENSTVYYMAEDGSLEELKTTVDTSNKTVTAELEHFSTYILVDKDTKSEDTSPIPSTPDVTPDATPDITKDVPDTQAPSSPSNDKENGPVALICIIIGAVLVIGFGVFFIIRKKK